MQSTAVQPSPTLADVHRDVRGLRSDVAEVRAVLVVLALVVCTALLVADADPPPPIESAATVVGVVLGSDESAHAPARCETCGSVSVYIRQGRPERCVRCGTRPAPPG